MGEVDHNVLNDDGLNAYLFGLVFDCPMSCDRACPVHNLPLPSLSATFDAIDALPRSDKLELVEFPLLCTTRRELAARALREEIDEGESGTLEQPDIKHLIPQYLNRY